MNTMIGMPFGQLSAVINVLFVLLIVSFLFNRYIEKAGNDIEGYTWLLVVIGVTYTQIAIGVLDTLLNWNAFFLGMLAYSASGFPMIYGAHHRRKDMVERAKKAVNEK